MEDNHFKLLILAFIHQNHTIPTYLSWSRTKSPNHDSEVIMWPSLNLFLGLFLTSSVQSLNRVRFFATPWTAALQVSLSITNSWSLLKLMSIELVMPSNYLILSPRSPPTLNLPQHKGLFQRVSSSHQVAKVLEFQLQHQSFQWIFRVDFL